MVLLFFWRRIEPISSGAATECLSAVVVLHLTMRRARVHTPLLAGAETSARTQQQVPYGAIFAPLRVSPKLDIVDLDRELSHGYAIGGMQRMRRFRSFGNLRFFPSANVTRISYSYTLFAGNAAPM